MSDGHTEPASVRTGVARAVGPAVKVLFIDRYRSGRLRLEGTSLAARWLVRLGVVFLVALNVSLLYASKGGWRQQRLVSVLPGNAPVFAPGSLVQFTLVALMVGWALVLWGAALSSTVVRLAVAAAFVLVNSTLGGSLLVPHAQSAGLRFGPTTVRAGYLAVPALLILASVAAAFQHWWRRLAPVVLGGLVAASVAMFGGLAWVDYAAQRNGGINVVPFGLGDSISTTRSLIVPVLFGAAVEVLELGYSAVAASTIPLRQLAPKVVKAVLAGLIAVKLTIELIAHHSEMAAFVRHRQLTALGSVMAIAFFAGAGSVLRGPLRRPAPAEGSAGDEGLIYGGAVALAMPLIVVVLLLSLGGLLFEQFNSVVRVLTLDLPADTIRRAGDLAIGTVLLLAGLHLLRQGRRRAVAAALVILGSWELAFAIPGWWGITLTVNPTLFDIVLTVGVAIVVVVRWRRLDTPAAAALWALVAFTWILSTQGAYLTKILGGFLPAAAIVTIVTGTLWALLTDSSFASGSSRLFPGGGRPLLWVGLLVTAATMTNWVAVTHDFDLSQPVARGGFVRLGMPLAAWWVLHRRFLPEPPAAANAGSPQAPQPAAS